MRKTPFAVGLLCFLLAALLTIPALAHGHRGHHGGHHSYAVQTEITVCPYDDCTTAGRHAHDGLTYCGYDHAGGVCNGSCYALCEVEDCTETGRHSHDGVTYCGYDHEAGFCDGACRQLCAVDGCKLSGLHTHSGTPCCGNAHETGFCDGSCSTTARHCRSWCR